MNPFPPLAFFGVGDTEMLLIMVAVLILFGGKKMPDFARGLGKTLKELRKATGEVEREFKRVMDEAENPPPPATFPKPSIPAPFARIEPASTPEKKPIQEPGPEVTPPPPSPPEDGREYHSDI